MHTFGKIAVLICLHCTVSSKKGTMRYLKLTLIALMLFSITLSAVKTQAADPIQVISQSMESHYLDRVTFRVTASSVAGKIIAARFFLQDRFDVSRIVYSVDRFTPAANVELSYTWDMRTVNLPPWQMVRYAWEIQDEAGNIYTTPYVEELYSDDTHSWETLSDGKVKVYWYGLSKDIGEALFDSAQKGFAHVAKATGYTPDHELRVVVFPTQEDYLPFHGQGASSTQDWVAGQTYNDMTVQWFDTRHPDFTLDAVVPHELAHAFLYMVMDGDKREIPFWFDEGQAMNNELVDIESEYLVRVREMAYENRLFRLTDMNNYVGFVADDRAKNDWYNQATSLVAFLYDQFGLEIYGKLANRIKGGDSFEEALKHETDWNLIEYEVAWRKWVGALPLSEAELAPTPTIELPMFPATPTPTS
jgi:hypothetical protein